VEGVDPLGVVVVAPGVEGPDVEELEFEAPAIQLLVVPGLTVNGADWAVAPVLSLSVRPRDVPEVKLTFHVIAFEVVGGN